MWRQHHSIVVLDETSLNLWSPLFSLTPILRVRNRHVYTAVSLMRTRFVRIGMAFHSSSHFVVYSTAENPCLKNKTSCGTGTLDSVSSDQYDVADENHFSPRRIEARCPQKMCITCGQTCGWSCNDFIWCISWRVAQRVGSHIPYISRRCVFKTISEAVAYTRQKAEHNNK